MSLYSESNYVRTEQRTHHAKQHALECARNRNRVLDRWGRVICCDYELAAVDLRGRLKWTRSLCGEIESFFDLEHDATAGDRSFFWFSFADSGCVARRYSYVPFRPLEAINYYRQGMRGLNYIAMLEPTIYASSSRKCPPIFKDLFCFEPLVSWHTHGLAWGDDRKKLRARFNNIEARQIYVPLIPNLKGCWAKFIKSELLGQKIAYMCKTPRLVNRVYCTNPDELFEERWIFKQKEAKARPGEHIHYFKVLSKYTLDQLAFAGGEGAKILQRVKAPFVRRVHA
jgi:hypothetical protein